MRSRNSTTVFGTEPRPDRAEFKTDHATTNHHKVLRHLRRERPSRCDDLFFVYFDAG